MCVTCLSEEQDASLLSTRYETLRKTIAQEKHNINTPYKLNQTKQAIKRGWFNELVCNEMLWQEGYGKES
jgi:hypothetical protein